MAKKVVEAPVEQQYNSLYNKYRPQTLKEVVGNHNVKSLIENYTSDLSTCPHVFLLTGGTGCGKTTLGRIIKTMLGSSGRDFSEIDSSHFRGIDTAREIGQMMSYGPVESDCRVLLCDEIHQFTKDAQDALLKKMEDVPQHFYFIFCTTDPQKLNSTFLGRCTKLEVEPPKEDELISLMEHIVKSEKKKVELKVLEHIVTVSKCMPRNAIQILDQILHLPAEKQMEQVLLAAESDAKTIDLCRALLKNESWKKVQNILKDLKGQDAEGVRRAVLGYCQSVLLSESTNKDVINQATNIISTFWESTWYTGFPGIVCNCSQIINFKLE